MVHDVKKIIVYGAGNNCIYSMNEIVRRFDVVGICDGDESKRGTSLFGCIVGNISDHSAEDYDLVVVTPSYSESIKQFLVDTGVSANKIIMLDEALAAPVIDSPIQDTNSPKDAVRDDVPDETGCSIAVIFYGGLGDYIIGKNWLYHLDEQAGLSGAGAMIDAYFSPNTLDNARAVFADSSLVRSILPIDTSDPELVDLCIYDLVLGYSIFPIVRYMNKDLLSKNEKLFSYASRLKVFGDEHYNTGFFSSHDFCRTVSSLFSLFPNRKYHELYDVLNDLHNTGTYHCSYSIMIDEEQYLSGLGLKNNRFITVNTGANEEYTRKPGTRTWSHSNWVKLIALLKENISSDIKIVRMGLADPGGTDTEADLDLCGMTSVEQAKVLLKNALVHIDYEGGLVHLRHVLCGKPSVVLHGPTSIERYGYAENTAIRSEKCPMACEWSSRDWLNVCHYDKDPLVCMRSITPGHVFEETVKTIEKEMR